MNPGEAIEGDWFPGRVPLNVSLSPSAYIESTYSFRQFRSGRHPAISMGEGASVYQGVAFDMGEDSTLTIGRFVLLNSGVRLIVDGDLAIGDYSLIAWSVVLMDTYRVSFEYLRARGVASSLSERFPQGMTRGERRPIRIGSNVWIGFESCVLPGVTIGDGAVVGARSVVTEDIPARAVAVGNPARVVRILEGSPSAPTPLGTE